MPRILLIDDDEIFREMLREMLEQTNYEVVEAATSDEGIEIFDRRKIDAIITDLFIPSEGGLGVIKHVRERDEHIGIIVISGMATNNRTTVLDQTLKIGANKALPKPVDNDILVQAIEELLSDSGNAEA